MKFSRNKPIYLQIIENVIMRIFTEEWTSGEKVASLRELAESYEVSLNTMQRALSELMREGFISMRRNSGRFITSDTDFILSQKDVRARQYINDFFKTMNQIGYNDIEIIEYLKQIKKIQ